MSELLERLQQTRQSHATPQVCLFSKAEIRLSLLQLRDQEDVQCLRSREEQTSYFQSWIHRFGRFEQFGYSSEFALNIL